MAKTREWLKTKGLKPKTINNALSVLRSSLRAAHRWNLIRRIPTFEWLRVPDPPFRFLTPAEEQALVDACEPGFWQTMVVLFLHTGVRFSEGAALRWKDVVTDNGGQPVLRVFKGGAEGREEATKSGRHRDLPLDPVVLTLLKELPREDDHIFPTVEAGGKLHPKSAYNDIRRFCLQAGIEPCGWHVLRHTFGTRLGAKGVPIQVIQRLMGHSTLRMTMRYVHFDPTTLSSTSAAIAGAMATPTSLSTKCPPSDA